MRGSAGEIGLKASGAEDYFGLIYIGDTSAFKKLVEGDASGITLEEDAIIGSLFDGIGKPDMTTKSSSAPKSSWRAGIPGASRPWPCSTLAAR